MHFSTNPLFHYIFMSVYPKYFFINSKFLFLKFIESIKIQVNDDTEESLLFCLFFLSLKQFIFVFQEFLLLLLTIVSTSFFI